uniref:Uncharacterized protein n=1 Tax=viral metagenome TaxID=1070528 RepID=A0A6M3LMF6_9ZZZZ
MTRKATKEEVQHFESILNKMEIEPPQCSDNDYTYLSEKGTEEGTCQTKQSPKHS